MTPEERQLITGLFDRMRGFGSPEKDKEAEALINQAVRTMPDAPYMLVQSVLVQEHALQEAGDRVKELEEQVSALKGGGQGRASGSGNFVGGLLGGGRPVVDPHAGSVPQVGARAAPSAFGGQAPWTQGQGGPQQSAPPASGSFLRTAMATAAGVAGGMLAAGAIRDLMSGNANASAAANSASTAANNDAARAEQARLDAENDARQDALDNDASWDSGGSGGDIEI